MIDYDIEIRESGQLTQEYKRKKAIKRIKVVVAFTASITALVVTKASQWSFDKLEELSRPVRLDLIDHKYGTNLRSQYFSGKRTQAILATKRQHGLI